MRRLEIPVFSMRKRLTAQILAKGAVFAPQGHRLARPARQVSLSRRHGVQTRGVMFQSRGKPWDRRLRKFEMSFRRINRGVRWTRTAVSDVGLGEVQTLMYEEAGSSTASLKEALRDVTLFCT